MNREDTEKVLAYLKDHAYKGACRIESVPALAKALSMKPGRVQAVLYFLCGEGVILREKSLILILKEEP